MQSPHTNSNPPLRLPSEPLPVFLSRLPPAQATSTFPADRLPPWYWIYNPHRPRPDPKPDITSFKHEGSLMLEGFQNDLAALRQRREMDKLPVLREMLRNGIAELARRCEVAAGKWMLFPPTSQVNSVWQKVCEGVDSNLLGTSAKVSTTSDGDRGERLICVYTKDFTDMADVRRVLLGLVQLGLVSADMPRGIMYKCDAYTWLEIYRQNEYGLRPSIYSSREMLSEGWGRGDVDVEMT